MEMTKDNVPVIERTDEGFFCSGPYTDDKGAMTWRVCAPCETVLDHVKSWKDGVDLARRGWRAYTPMVVQARMMSALSTVYRNAEIKPQAVWVAPVQFDALCDLPGQTYAASVVLEHCVETLSRISKERKKDRELKGLIQRCRESLESLTGVIAVEPTPVAMGKLNYNAKKVKPKNQPYHAPTKSELIQKLLRKEKL